MSSWKLVEAEIIEDTKGKNTGKSKKGSVRHTKRRPKTTINNVLSNNASELADQASASALDPFLSLDEKDKEYYIHMAIQHIEAMFSFDNLSMDTILRSYMDAEGYVPLVIITSYQHVSCFGVPHQILLHRLAAKAADAYTFEVDVTHATIRLREKWDMWLMPSTTGANIKGLPPYSLQPGPIELSFFPGVYDTDEYYYHHREGDSADGVSEFEGGAV